MEDDAKNTKSLAGLVRKTIVDSKSTATVFVFHPVQTLNSQKLKNRKIDDFCQK